MVPKFDVRRRIFDRRRAAAMAMDAASSPAMAAALETIKLRCLGVALAIYVPLL